MTPEEFIALWKDNKLTERGGAQAHFDDLCDLIGVDKPRDPENYCFEHGAKKSGGGDGWADVWKRGCFGWENKKPGRDLATALHQLTDYALQLENPPLLVVSDRERIIIHTAFTGYPDEPCEIRIEELADPEKRQILRWVFTDPPKLRPEKSTAAITAEAAGHFAGIARTMRKRGLDGQRVAHFLVQCLFAIFAEDENLLPGSVFTEILKSAGNDADRAAKRINKLFAAMQQKTGGEYGDHDIAWFNGGLFKTIDVPVLTADDLSALYAASANMDWRAIDPTIFGTLFERGLDPAARAPLGAHYTDTGTIAKLIYPLITEPLLAKWQTVKAIIAAGQGKGPRTKEYKTARAAYQGFLLLLHLFQVLDPACGSGNFLYLALKALRDLEKQVRIEARELGLEAELLMQTGPHNIRGIEINEFAAELARVTVWIGDIQWCRRNGREIARDPILRPLDGIEHRDALLNPDNSEAAWPQADVIVGNPPFLGGSKMLGELGEDYVSRLRKLYEGRVPGGADLVTYWFEKARAQIEAGHAQTAGLVATNSIRGGSSRKVLDRVVETTPIFAAWSDEPWVNEGAAVRVSLICFGNHECPNLINRSKVVTPVKTGVQYWCNTLKILDSGVHRNDDFGAFSTFDQFIKLDGQHVSKIYADLTAYQEGETGSDLATARALVGSVGAAFRGADKIGRFDVLGELAREWLRLPCNPNGKPNKDVVRPWSNGLDIVRRPSDTWIIDFANMEEADASYYEAPFEYAVKYVKPTRVLNRREARARYWWRHGEVMPSMRNALKKVTRYIITPRVSKYRLFAWVPTCVLADSAVIAIARDDDTTFGILHSRFHELWSLALGTSLEDRPRYTPTTCFETFPFPPGLTPNIPAADYVENTHAKAIAEAAFQLNQLRENWLNPPEWVDWVISPEEEKAGYPKRPVAKPGYEADLKKRTLTNLYNARPAWLDMAHKTLDKAVAAAYGWEDYTPDLSDKDILHRLLALNRERGSLTDR